MEISALLKGLPVVMYHVVNTEINSLSTHPAVFEMHCKAMAKEGWHAVSLEEAEDYFLNDAPLPRKSVWLTFDDGTLDNLTYAYPILEKYGLKGTIFPVLNLLEKSEEVRPTIKDVWAGHLSMCDLPVVDYPFAHNHEISLKERKSLFLNWNELRFLDKTGVMQTAPHSLTHESVLGRVNFNGFYRPYNRNRTFDRIWGGVPWGLPKFKPMPLLASPAFVPSPRLVEGIINIVPQSKLEAALFFKDKKNVRKIKEFIASFTDEELGSFEPEEDTNKRMRDDLFGCQAIMEREMGKKSLTFCWPWGKSCPKALEYGKEAGFKIFVTTKRGGNYPGRPEKVCRFSVKFPTDEVAIMRRLNLLSCNLAASFYGLFQFRWKHFKRWR